MSEPSPLLTPLIRMASPAASELLFKPLSELASNSVDERDTTTIAGKFAEALGCLEDAICCLGQVNEQYDAQEHIDDIRLVLDYGLRPCNPVMDFWLQAEQAEDKLKAILCKLQHVEPLAPKETRRKLA